MSRSRSSTWDNIDANHRVVDDANKTDEIDAIGVEAPPCLPNDTNKLSIGKKTSGFVKDSDSHTESFAHFTVPSQDQHGLKEKQRWEKK